MTNPEIKTIGLNEIRIDGGTNMREEIDEGHVQRLAEAFETGATLPPLVVFYDGRDYWLADGFHRYFAYQQVDHLDVECEVHDGDLAQAKIHACGANASHGLPRSNEDKRLAVRLQLAHPERKGVSDRKIAAICKVSHTLVAKVRREPAEIRQRLARERGFIDGKS